MFLSALFKALCSRCLAGNFQQFRQAAIHHDVDIGDLC